MDSEEPSAAKDNRLPRAAQQGQERDRLSKVVRHQRILAQLAAAPTLRASELAVALSVSGETIRRDLLELHELGLINRTYGGASRPFALEAARSDRRQVMVAEREAIASAVSAMILPKEVLMLGGGSTTYHVARLLAARNRDITVITHDFASATALGTNPTIRVLFCAGRLHPGEGYLLGAQTLASINGYEANRAIVGATGVGARGIYDVDEEAGAVYAAMIQRAAEAIVVADHSKFDQLAVAMCSRWDAIDRLVTDRQPQGALAGALREAGTEVVVADA
ncbi:DeoR/GlpR family DNA-binding transcription regulator [Labrys monachus]|uniref:DeoR/GlpR family transcriptional regulator of sugar metabolism n=1 Tax=Labrys monachus TaxID=217067 RepID=A0ABU0F8T0_9HYPH|nr:DeoR/GlpR family DNA-binding transcription regulator [Labrys monachus]MDQ0391012.1 DeoR/GlpR family transcriptional regulator of sugar metabolism [Labrys monachus]